MNLKFYSGSKKACVGCLFVVVFLGQFVEAINPSKRAKVDSLVLLATEAKIDTVVAKAMYSLGRVYKRIDSDTALMWLDKLIAFGDGKQLEDYVVKGYMLMANIHRFDKNIEYSKATYKIALNKYQEMNNINGIAQANACVMKCLMLQPDSNEDSIYYYFNKVQSIKDSINPRIRGDLYADYTHYLLQKDRYRLAIDNLTSAINIYESYNDQLRLLNAKNTLAAIHLHLNNIEKAVEIFEELMPAALELKSYGLYIALLINWGNYGIKDDAVKAQEYFRKGLWYANNFNVKENTDILYASLARSKLKIGDADSSIIFANKALEIAKNKGYGHEANLILGEAYTKKKNFVEAEKYLKGFIKYQKDNGYKENLVVGYKFLGKLFEEKKNYKKAIEFHKLYSLNKDSLYTDENSSKMADMDAWYWSAQKRHELELAKKNEELKTKEAQQAIIKSELFASQRNGLIIAIGLVLLFSVLIYRINLQRRKNKLMQKVTELELKAIRAQMNPHFMFNVLSAVQMFINKSDIRQANIGLAKFGKLMRLILENSEKPTISLDEEIKTLKLYIELESLRFPFNYTLDIDSSIDKENMEIPSMIIQPYIENAIKHGISTKVNNGNINIKFRKIENQLYCTVEDDGVGRDISELTKSKYSQHKSMGTRLSKERLELVGKQISGKAEVEIEDLYSDKGDPKGTLVKLNIPITYHEN